MLSYPSALTYSKRKKDPMITVFNRTLKLWALLVVVYLMVRSRAVWRERGSLKATFFASLIPTSEITSSPMTRTTTIHGVGTDSDGKDGEGKGERRLEPCMDYLS